MDMDGSSFCHLRRMVEEKTQNALNAFTLHAIFSKKLLWGYKMDVKDYKSQLIGIDIPKESRSCLQWDDCILLLYAICDMIS